MTSCALASFAVVGGAGVPTVTAQGLITSPDQVLPGQGIGLAYIREIAAAVGMSSELITSDELGQILLLTYPDLNLQFLAVPEFCEEGVCTGDLSPV